MDVVWVVTFILGWNPGDTETSSHSKVRDHRDGQNQAGEPVENPSLPLDSEGKDKNTDETEGEERKHHPKSRMAGMSSVQKPHIGSRERAGRQGQVSATTVMVAVTVVRVMRVTRPAGRSDRDGTGRFEFVELHDDLMILAS